MILSNIKGLIKQIARDSLYEHWFGDVTTNWKYDNKMTSVFENPSKSEIAKLSRGGKNPLRFIISLDGNLYVWDNDGALHDEVSRQLKLGYRVKGVYYNPSYIEFLKVKTPEKIYAEVDNSYLNNLLDKDYKDNQLRK